MNANGAPMSPSQAVDAGPAVLHIRFSARRFILWAEAVGAPLDPRAPRVPAVLTAWPREAGALSLFSGKLSAADPRGQVLKKLVTDALDGSSLEDHPRCVGGSALIGRLHEASLVPVNPTDPAPSTRRLAPGDTPLRMPTASGIPLRSPAAGGDPTACGDAKIWRVRGATLPVEDADPWLRPFRVRGANLVLAPEWAQWWRVAALVRGLVARGFVAPSSVGAIPCWNLVTGGRHIAGLQAAIAALPPATLDPEDVSRGDVDTFLGQYADVLVRQAASRQPDLRHLLGRNRGASPAERWLSALLGPDPTELPPRLAREPGVMVWLADPAGLHGPPRLVLRLDEPRPEQPEAWPLTVLVESRAEPGALFSLAELRALSPGPGRVGSELRERLLEEVRRGLAVAANEVPALASMLDARAALVPGEVPLDLESAWSLLMAARPTLEVAGVRVLVPAWWTAPRPRARLRIAKPLAGHGLLSAGGLVRFEWQVAVGDVTLSPEEFDRLVERRVPLVRLAGGWAVLPPDTAKALQSRWSAHGPRGELPAGPALLLAISTEAEAQCAVETEPGAKVPGNMPPVELDADAEVLAQMRALSAQAQEMPEPPGFAGTLRPYQRRGLAWLQARASLGVGGILADDMGLGKTVQVLALLAQRRSAGEVGPTLVVAPTSVVANWAAEAARFVPGVRVLVHHGDARRRGEALARAVVTGVDVVVTTYALLWRDAEALAAVRWDGVVLDEAQNVKNASTKQAQAARGLRAHYRLALTGTPIENTLSDLWSIFAFVHPGYLGSQATFRRRLAEPIESGQDAAAARLLHRLVGPLVLRRTKDEPGVAADLPPRVETLQHCSLTREQAALYEAVTREMLRRIGAAKGMARRAAVLTTLLRLKQVCDHPALFTGDDGPLAGRSGKLERLEELLAEVTAAGDKMLIFTQFASWGRRLANHLALTLPGVPVLRLDGGQQFPDRAHLVERFQQTPGPAAFVLSLKAGGAGLNLTAARVVCHYDRWWNPAVERQATDRAHRIGQTRTVLVHTLLCPGTLEEHIDRLIRDKRALAASVLDASAEAWLTELDDGALRELLCLRRAALS